MTSGGLKANTVFGNTASASVDTGDTSFLTDFSQSANGGMIDTNDVDPIAEAEVYMAYGRDAQAEEILKDAISKEPKRHELHLKLLEMYAASKNLSAFETIAGELYTSLGAEDPTWAKVAEIGIKLEPNNPLYQANSAPTGMAGSLDASDFANTPLAAEKDLDFSFDNDSLTQDFAPESVPVLNTATEDVSSLDLPKFDADEVALDSKQPELANDALDFNMGDFSESTSIVADNLAGKDTLAEDRFSNTMPALEMPTFDAPKFMPDSLANTSIPVLDLNSNSLEINTFAEIEEPPVAFESQEKLVVAEDLNVESFDFLQTELPKENTEPEGVLDISGLNEAESVADFNAMDFGADNDFNFDVETISPEASKYVDDSAMELNPFDLDTINLDLNDGITTTTAEADAEEVPAELSVSGIEPIEVETKLDLVAAYIEMDDKEGAKELLDEVMKEGGAGQRKRAEQLLAKMM